MAFTALARLTREPNVVPMIDVLLVLLIIFMIAQVPRRSLELQLPQSESTGGNEASIVLSVEAGPRYSINGSEIAFGALRDELWRVFQDRPRKILFVKGAPKARYQDVVAAFDMARGAGVHATGVVLPSAAR